MARQQKVPPQADTSSLSLMVETDDSASPLRQQARPKNDRPASPSRANQPDDNPPPKTPAHLIRHYAKPPRIPTHYRK